MGTWSYGIFDNDTASDWLYEFNEVADLSLITQVIDAVFEEEYIDADVATEALVAVDVLARLLGRYGVQNSYTKLADDWVQKYPQVPPQALIDKAMGALDAILGNDSELKELWEDSAESDAWQAEVKALKQRLVAR